MTTGLYNTDGSYRISADAIGTASDTAWNGTDTSASLISIMKAVYAQTVLNQPV